MTSFVMLFVATPITYSCFIIFCGEKVRIMLLPILISFVSNGGSEHLHKLVV